MAFLILVICAAFTGWMSIRIHKSLFTPWAMYLMAWFVMIGLYSLEWLRYSPIPMGTWALLWGSIATYTLGAMFAVHLRPRSSSFTLPTPADWFSGVDMRHFSKIQAVISIIGILGSVGYFRSVDSLFGANALVDNPGLVRGMEGNEEYIETFFWWKFAFYMNWLAVPLGVARIAYQGRKCPLWVFGALIAHLAVNLALVSRGHLLLVLFLLIFVTSAAFRPEKRRWEPGLIALLLLAVLTYFVLRGEALGKTYDYIISSSGGFYGPEPLEPLAGIYLYVTGNLPGFDAYISNNSGNHTFGLFQILPLAKLLGKAGVITADVPNEVGEFYGIPMPFNTYTYLNVFYRDWGLLGVLLGPFLFGYLANSFFMKTCNGGKIWHLLLLALLTHASVSSIGTNVLVSTPQWEFGVAILILAFLARKRGAPALYPSMQTSSQIREATLSGPGPAQTIERLP